MKKERKFLQLITLAGVVTILLLPCFGCVRSQDWDKKNDEVESLYNQKNYEAAEKAATVALEIAEKNYGPQHINVAKSLNNLAMIYRAQGEIDRAVEYYNNALELKRKILDADNPSIANTLNNLGVLYAASDDYLKAESMFKDALRIWTKKPDENVDSMIFALDNLVRLYKRMGDQEEAAKYKKLLDKLTPSIPLQNPSGY